MKRRIVAVFTVLMLISFVLNTTSIAFAEGGDPEPPIACESSCKFEDPQLPSTYEGNEYTVSSHGITVTFSNKVIENDKVEFKSVSWRAITDIQIRYVYVKAGTGGIWHTYTDQKSGTGLTGPEVKGISHVTFFYNAVEMPTTGTITITKKIVHSYDTNAVVTGDDTEFTGKLIYAPDIPTIVAPPEYNFEVRPSMPAVKSQIPFGRYRVIENSKDGYELQNAEPMYVNITSSDPSDSIELVNKKVKGEVTIYKDLLDKDGNNLDGAGRTFEIRLTGPDNVGTIYNVPVRTDYKTILLPIGVYKVEEVNPPSKFNVTISDPTFTLTSAGQRVTVTNKAIPDSPPVNGAIEVKKTIGDTGIPQANVTFGVFEAVNGAKGSQLANHKTGASGLVNFEGYVPGTYYVEETPVIGFEPREYSHAVTVTSEETAKVEVKNDMVLNDGVPYSYTGSISGYKFNDLDGDKTWDSGELGIGGWKISLYQGEISSEETPYLETTTRADGYYNFEKLQAGTYTILEESRSNWTPTMEPSRFVVLGDCEQTEGFNTENLSSDVDYKSAMPDRNSAFVAEGRIGRVGDYELDIQTLNPTTVRAQSDVDGWSNFALPQPFRVSYNPTTQAVTYEALGRTLTYTLTTAPSALTDIMIRTRAAVADSGIIINNLKLTELDGTDITTINASSAASNPEKDRDILWICSPDIADGFILEGTSMMYWKEGNKPNNSQLAYQIDVGSSAHTEAIVENFANREGVQQNFGVVKVVKCIGPKEIPQKGVEFKLHVGNEDIRSEITNVHGEAIFEHIPTGTYTLEEVKPDGFNSTMSIATDPEEEYSRAIAAAVIPPNLIQVTVKANKVVTVDVTNTPITNEGITYDSGLKIKGYKFNDLDKDGIRDAGEPGIPNWVIRLYHNQMSPSLKLTSAIDIEEWFIETTTDANGYYEFTELDPGAYIVEEVQQAGWQCSTGVKKQVYLRGNNWDYGVSTNNLLDDVNFKKALPNENTFFEAEGRIGRIGDYELAIKTMRPTTVVQTQKDKDGWLNFAEPQPFVLSYDSSSATVTFTAMGETLNYTLSNHEYPDDIMLRTRAAKADSGILVTNLKLNETPISGTSVAVNGVRGTDILWIGNTNLYSFTLTGESMMYWSSTSVPKNSELAYQIAVGRAAEAQTEIIDFGNYKLPIDDDDDDDDEPDTPVVVITKPDLVVTKTDNGATVIPGGLAEYTITVENKGNAIAQGVKIYETLPEYTLFAAEKNLGWVLENGKYVYSLGNLNVGEKKDVKFVLQVASELPRSISKILNNVEVKDNGIETAMLDNKAYDDTIVTRAEIIIQPPVIVPSIPPVVPTPTPKEVVAEPKPKVPDLPFTGGAAEAELVFAGIGALLMSAGIVLKKK